MIKKDLKKRGGAVKTHIRVVEGYRPGPGMPTRQRTIKSFGYLEDQKDPILFMKEVEEFNNNFKENVPLRIEVAGNALMYSKGNRKLNYGYKFLEAIYNLLEIDSFIEDYEKKNKFRGEYSIKDIFKFLSLLRILNPDSKRASSQIKKGFYGMQTNFTLQDIYRSLDHFSNFEIELQRYLNEHIKEKIGRDLSHIFYDVTNYFFDIDFSKDNDLRKRGVSKEHRVDPIVTMGLFIDSNGLPVSMSIFPGNTSDSLTLKPTMEDLKKSYGINRLIVVADKGLNSSNNIDMIVNNKDGYIFSQILRGKKGKRYQDKLFSEDTWVYNKDRTYKYKLFTEEYEVKDKNGMKEIRKRKVLLYWSKKDEDMNRLKREEKLEKAERFCKNNAYSIKKGVDEYTKEEIIDKNTNQPIDNAKKRRIVDMEKALQDEEYDGYFCIITSELDYDERKIRNAYSGLWKIEESFRILKSDLYARPVFLSKSEHIRAHFLICFVSLLVVRIVQYLMKKNVISAERITRALSSASCKVLKGGIIEIDDVGGAIAFKKTINKKNEIVETLTYSDEDEIALDYKAIQNTFGVNFYNIYTKQEEFNRFLKNIGINIEKKFSGA